MLTLIPFNPPGDEPESVIGKDDGKEKLDRLEREIRQLKRTVRDYFSTLNTPGALNLTQAKIQNSTIEDSTIGATTPAAGKFTTIETSGNVGIGVTPTAKLDVAWGGSSVASTILAGADQGAFSSRTDATQKWMSFGVPHYTNSEEPTSFANVISGSSSAVLRLGGGTSAQNAVTSVEFYTAANNTTTTGTLRVAITSDGRLYGTALHNNAGAVTGTTNQYVASGTYTPTLTGIANVDGTSAVVCQWMRVGNVVTVSGSLNIDPTSANTFTRVGISLPIASNFSGTNQAGGTGGSYNGTTNDSAYIFSDSTNDRAEWACTPGSAGDTAWWFAFQYEVL